MMSFPVPLCTSHPDLNQLICVLCCDVSSAKFWDVGEFPTPQPQARVIWDVFIHRLKLMLTQQMTCAARRKNDALKKVSNPCHGFPRMCPQDRHWVVSSVEEGGNNPRVSPR